MSLLPESSSAFFKLRLVRSEVSHKSLSKCLDSATIDAILVYFINSSSLVNRSGLSTGSVLFRYNCLSGEYNFNVSEKLKRNKLQVVVKTFASNSMKQKSYTITTVSLNSEIKSKVNLGVLYWGIRDIIDSGNTIVTGAKMENYKHGDCNWQTKAFANQVTLTLDYNGIRISIKIFLSGQMQVSGCKDPDTATDVISNVVDILKTISGTYICEKAQVVQGLLVDVDKNFILGRSSVKILDPFQVQGYLKQDGKIILHSVLVSRDEETGLYFHDISKSERIQAIYNNYGEVSGTKKISLVRSRKKVSKHFSQVYIKEQSTETTSTFHLIDKYHDNTQMGKVHIEVSVPNQDLEIIPENFPVQYSALDKWVSKKDITVTVTSINMQFQYFLNQGESIDLLKLEKIYNDYNIPSDYEENGHHALKVKYAFNEFKNGVCICKDLAKCTCDEITLMIFHSGKIIVSGSKTNYMNDCLYDRINDFLKKRHYEFVYVQEMYDDLCRRVGDSFPELTIDDLVREINDSTYYVFWPQRRTYSTRQLDQSRQARRFQDKVWREQGAGKQERQRKVL